MNTAAVIAPQPPGSLLDGPRRWLAQVPEPVFAIYAGLMTFGTYFAMYAFRKPFAVASFDGMATGLVSYKVALVIAQVIGYALAKLIGVKVIAELPARLRITGILVQIAFAELVLVLFALIPPPWNIICLFLDGLALGMVWGMVFGFVEGRRQSDLIGAMLCASLILSSGMVKSVGEWVMLNGIASPFWMPAVTGLLFTPLLAVCLLGLAIMPPPNPADIAGRVERVPMDARARKRLFQSYAPGLIALVLIYVMLTALRDFRDNFAAEIWNEVGMGGRAGIFAWSEIPISLLVLVVLAAQTLIRDNRTGLIANLALIGCGLVLAGLSSLAFSLHLLGPVAWMITVGGGLYLAYTPFNGMLFDRLVAATGEVATAGFLIYIADASGYAGSVALVLLRTLDGLKMDWAGFLVDISLVTSAFGLVLLGYAALYFRGKAIRAESPA